MSSAIIRLYNHTLLGSKVGITFQMIGTLTLLKLRLAIVALLLTALFPALALELSEVQGATLFSNYLPFSLVLISSVILALGLPARLRPHWLGIAMLSLSAYFILIIGFEHFQSITIPALTAIIIFAISLFLIVAISCWIHSFVTGFEDGMYQFAMNDLISNIRDPESEESVQSMLMISRYTEQPLGFVAIDVCQQTEEKLKSQFVERLFKKVAEEHWRNEISRKLRKELRIIDKFYKLGSGNRLLLMCPGLSEKELAELSAKLESAISDSTNSTSFCSHVSFPNEAMTLEGLITCLDEKSKEKFKNHASRPASGKAEKIPAKTLVTRTLVEEQRE